MNTNPVIAAEAASDLRQDIFKIGLSVCLFMPICSFIASIFLSVYSSFNAATGEELSQSFIKSPYYSLYSLITATIPMLICIVLLLFLFKRKLSPVMLKPSTNPKKFAALTLSSFILVPIASAVAAITATIMQNAGLSLSSTPAPSSTFETLCFILAHAVFAPVLEEILFRGLILERLRRYGDLFAVLTSALLFSLLHASFQSYAYAFISGVIFALLAVYTGSTLAPILVHILNNAISVLMIILEDKIGSSYIIVFYAIMGILIMISVISVLSVLRNQPDSFEFKFSGKEIKKGRKAGIVLLSLPIMIFIIMSLMSALSSAAAN